MPFIKKSICYFELDMKYLDGLLSDKEFGSMRHDADVATPARPTSNLSPLTPAQFADLSKNEFRRYCMSSDVTGYVVIAENPAVPPLGIQFALPDSAPEAPFVVNTFTDLALISLGVNGKKVLVGKYAQSQYASRRDYKFSIQVDNNPPIHYTLYPLSPTKNPLTKEERQIIYDASSIKRANDTEEARDKFDRTPKKVKEGDWMQIKNADVRVRMENPRSCDQSSVMGLHYAQKMGLTGRFRKTRTAKEEVKEVLENNRCYFSADMVRALERMAYAPFRYAEAKDPNFFQEEKQSYPEWLHRDAHNLHPLDRNPQRADNLGAAEMRYNTAMMIGERTLQFFALHVPTSENAEKCRFDMLLDTEVIDRIHFFVMLQIGRMKVVLEQHIDLFPQCPQDVKASDLAGFLGILHCLLQNVAPVSRQSVKSDAYIPSIQRHRLVGNVARPVFLLDESSEEDEDMRPAQRRRLEIR